MPSYDYECKSCGHLFEAFQSMSDSPLKKCPECSKNSLRRLIGGGSGIIFKGSGFYVNDSRSSKSAATTGSKNSSGDSKKAETTGSESKSESGASGGGNEAKTA